MNTQKSGDTLPSKEPSQKNQSKQDATRTKTAKKKSPLTPEQKKARKEKNAQKREQNAQKKSIRGLFATMGFHHIHVENKEFNYTKELPRVELDDIFYSENTIMIVEYTVTKSNEKSKEHLRRKRALATSIHQNPLEFEKFLINHFPNHFKESSTQKNIRYLYCSKYSVSEEIKSQYSNIVIFLSGQVLKYFRDLTAIIRSFSKYEFEEFLGIDKNSSQKNEFTAYIVNNATSKFEHKYALVTFYATPEALLSRAYVLRSNSWRNPDDYIYQRHLKKDKIVKIREYLNANGQSFPNNIILTLRRDSVSFSFEKNDALIPLKLSEDGYFTYQDDEGVKHKLEGENKTIKLTIVDQYGTIGVIDGQHRLFSYAHESMEEKRKSSKLLVTGILLPKQHSENDSRKLEAKLFKSINTPQTAPPESLNLYIEEMLTPCSVGSINKRIVELLADENMPLHKIIPKKNQPSEGLIPTSSIISYGLNTYLRFTSKNPYSMYNLWKETIDYIPIIEGTPPELSKEDAQKYVEFSSTLIKNYLVAFKKQLEAGQWNRAKRGKTDEVHKGILTATTIAGIILCMQKYLQNNPSHATLDFKFETVMNTRALNGFNFKNYSGGSSWKRLGNELYDIIFKCHEN